MTDTELLELAAKAAGMNIQRSRLEDPLCQDFLMNGSNPRNRGQVAFPWNPLTDDGDALRLAVKLHIDIQSYQESGNVHAHSKQFLGYGTDGVPSYQDHECMTEHLGDAPMAATRRAIVRAAAEIGRATP